MSDVTNIVYNGDFSKGTDSWTGSGITVSGGVVTLTGDLRQNSGGILFMPFSSNRRYRLTYDLKMNTISGSSNFYIALYPYDNNRNGVITVADVLKRTNSLTTLASDLKSGDTTVTLTSSTGWTTGYVNIYQSKTWGTNRATTRLTFSSISGNTVTLSSAYSGTTIPAGTSCANGYSSSTYFYPHYITNANLKTEWTTYTAEFTGGNGMRYSCQYAMFGTLGYSHNYSMRNIKIECISDYQECPMRDYIIAPQFCKTGIVDSPFFNEVGLYARYVRDSIAGSTANTNNHWNEVQIFNDVGENIAWGKTVKAGSETWTNSYITDGVVDSHYNLSDTGVSSSTSLVIDIGYVEHITKLKIWHYYPDGRTYYNNKTEVSLDGTNWFTVYNGQKPETVNGNEILLFPYQMSIYNSGDIHATNFIEY